jgi:hypothetical protein
MLVEHEGAAARTIGCIATCGMKQAGVAYQQRTRWAHGEELTGDGSLTARDGVETLVGDFGTQGSSAVRSRE